MTREFVFIIILIFASKFASANVAHKCIDVGFTGKDGVKTVLLREFS